jgi:predicted unusual protein kinase regulating ubiquinone biosynthesis (AarF/ABC1/UbiB family)
VDPAPYYAELRQEIGAETDYRREAAQTQAFAEAVRAFPELHVPRVFPELSAGMVLTTEWVEGERLDQVAARELAAEERFRLGRLLVLATLGPALTSHVTHGDPNPGNFLVRPDGRLTVLDFGAMKQLSAPFVRAFWGIIHRELEGPQTPLLPQFRAAGFRVHTPEAEAEATLQAVHDFAAAPLRQERYDWTDGALVGGIRQYGREHFRALAGIQFPPEALLFYRAIGGMVNNLRALKAEGPFRAVCVELDAVRKSLHPEG